MTAELFGSTLGNCNTSYYSSSNNNYNYYTRYREQQYEASIFEESIESESSSNNNILESKMSKFKTYLEAGDEGKALKAYNELLDAMSKQKRYSNLVVDGDNSLLKAQAKVFLEKYLTKKTGESVDLADYIKKHAASAFERGFQWFGNMSTETEEDLLNAMCDMDESTGFVNDLKSVGGRLCNIGASTAVGAAAGAAIGSIVPGIGTAVGAVVGGVVGFIKGLFF